MLLKGGLLFPEDTKACILGSAAHGALKIRWLGIGLRMEISIHGRRISTSPVQSITIELDADRSQGRSTACQRSRHFKQSTPATFSSDATGCPTGYAGRFSFDATLTSVGSQPLSELAVEIADITSGNLLLRNDELLWEGQSFSVADGQGSANATMMPGESVTVPFTVCLERRAAFQLFVNVRGIAHD